MMSQFTVDIEEISFTGENLFRPECVLCTARGNIYTADWNGGVACLKPDGRRQLILPAHPPFPLKPNDIALCRDGTFLLANLGDEGGCIGFPGMAVSNRCSLNWKVRPCHRQIS